MPAYLFLWNPEKDGASFKDYDRVLADANAGRPYETRWTCPSKRPRKGDRAYVQRTGRRSNGVFARGQVSRDPYVDDDGTRG